MRLSASAILTAGFLLSASALADTQGKPAQLGLCAACHGETGIAVQHDTPNLAGQNVAYLKAALAAYRSGERDVAVMRAATGTLSVADVERLAQWYAQQPACVAPVEH